MELPEEIRKLLASLFAGNFGNLSVVVPTEDYVAVGKLTDQESFRARRLEADRNEIARLERTLTAKKDRFKADAMDLMLDVEDRLGIPGGTDVRLHGDRHVVEVPHSVMERAGLRPWQEEPPTTPEA